MGMLLRFKVLWVDGTEVGRVCQLQGFSKLRASGGFATPQTRPSSGSAPRNHWGLLTPRPSVPTLPPNPGYATGLELVLPRIGLLCAITDTAYQECNT